MSIMETLVASSIEQVAPTGDVTPKGIESIEGVVPAIVGDHAITFASSRYRGATVPHLAAYNAHTGSSVVKFPVARLVDAAREGLLSDVIAFACPDPGSLAALLAPALANLDDDSFADLLADLQRERV